MLWVISLRRTDVCIGKTAYFRRKQSKEPQVLACRGSFVFGVLVWLELLEISLSRTVH